MSYPGLEGSLTCGTGTGNFGVHRLQMESTSKGETCQWVAKPELTFEADTIFCTRPTFIFDCGISCGRGSAATLKVSMAFDWAVLESMLLFLGCWRSVDLL